MLFRYTLIGTSPEQSSVLQQGRDSSSCFEQTLCETWHLHSCFLRQSPMSPSDARVWAKSSKKAGFVSHISMDHLWSISPSYLFYCQPFLQSIMCSSIQRNVKAHYFGVSGFSHGVYTYYPSHSSKQAHSQWLLSQNASDSTILG